MAVSVSTGTLSEITGLQRISGWTIVAWLCVSHHLLLMTNAEKVVAKTSTSFVAKDEMPLASSSISTSSSFQELRRKQFPTTYSVNLALSPALTPNYGLVISGHAARYQSSKPDIMDRRLTSSISGFRTITSAEAPAPGLQSPEHSMPPQVSNCCGPDMVMLRGSEQCHCVYPVKVDLVLLNVSQSPNWDLFLEEFATGLGLNVSQMELINFYWTTLASLNISLDITPDKGISFSAADVSAINNTLSWHKLYLNSNLVGVGDYKLLSLTWYQPPAPTPAPVVAAPSAEPPFAPAVTSNSSLTSKKKRGRHTSLIVICSLSAVLLIIASVTMFIVCNCSARKEKPSVVLGEPEKPRTVESDPRGGSVTHPSSLRFIPYEELKKATNNFEPASLLGEGGFGRVYGGVLSDGKSVAIKKLTSGGQQGDKEFLVEVDMLSRLHHRNLVKLLGYYSSRQPPQNLLCYELVPNGSLESWLHGPSGVNCPLDWHTRMKIALDAARGLAYLHEDSQPCVIHRDFKASNILLENDFHAKVADFGLAKLAPEGQANYLSTRVMGTFGYVAPEYAMTGHLLVKSDVYSYGVVLLELITGRPPVDMLQPSGQENLVTWTRPILRNKDRLEELADPKLQGTYPRDDFVRVCTIAAACVASEANQRPTMGEVVQSLKIVQRVNEHPESTSRTPAHKRSTTFDSDGTSSIFSSGPYSGLIFDHDSISRTAGLSEDLHEGR